MSSAAPPTDTTRTSPFVFIPAVPPEGELNHARSAPTYQNVYPSILPPADQRRIPTTTASGSGDPHINGSVIVILAILSLVFILSGLLHLLARCMARQRHPPARYHSPLVSALHGQLQHLFHLHDAGVEQAFIDTLPVFTFGSIRGLKDSTDCAVCLTEFGDDDRLRLLPKCKHAFHLDCIDTWLLSNSTCPVCRRSLLPEPIHGAAGSSRHGQLEVCGVSTDDAMNSYRFIHHDHQRRLSLEEQLIQESRRFRSLHGSIHGSYQNSFRISDVMEEDQNSDLNEIQEIQELEGTHHEECKVEPPSPVAPTIRITDEHGMQRDITVELGRVAARVKSDSRRLMGSAARSYSMGSYEYIVDPSSWILMIEPTPYPGRPGRDWAPSKPTHRSALSDSIPELASASGTPANDELFWASRGLYNPQTLARVRELLAPVSSNPFSPGDYLEDSYSPGFGDQWIDIDIERGEVIEDEEGRRDLYRHSSASSSSSSSASSSSPSAVVLVTLQKDSSDFKQRSSSLSRLPEEKGSVSLCRRSLSETSLGVDQDGKMHKSCSRDVSGKLFSDPISKQGSFSRRFSFHWLTGRNKRAVFSAVSPSPMPITI
ncbi:uncharacterized protein [Physcomitrium patens]|uniref:RING-type E3 ubiquitin transferase n=1 Tax=Physcomitrium patens TaxID=3218 RepID=A0A2K1IIT8_PHYPA|nr:putative RING-H2 finger protein ATL49 [Physcomitrium patens]PNR29192.1 hypothetical protein PHYPA_027884 [Physcomitrium patens]|eukprot:XP_024362520.1 putative RING-H2 finger protein ATL49 [Physcomitrella patens]